MHLHLIGGARPNFMKIAPLWHGLRGHPVIQSVFVHTGQHKEINMAGQIWRGLGLPTPDHVLPASATNKLADIQAAYRVLCQNNRPDMILVVGDVTSSVAAANVAKERDIPLIHLEAGLRCFDPDMVEERNRVAIDSVADLLLAPSKDAVENLLAEGILPARIKLVGNIMIDTLAMMKTQIDQEETARKIGLGNGRYVLVTLHRQGNVDDPTRLHQICAALMKLATKADVCFVLHPRTERRLLASGLIEDLRNAGLRLLPPMGYVEFTNLMKDAGVVVTDSGGVQEETTSLGVLCLTLRKSTERPITITQGTNQLVELDQMVDAVTSALFAFDKRARVPADIPWWDGKTADRVIRALEDFLEA